MFDLSVVGLVLFNVIGSRTLYYEPNRSLDNIPLKHELDFACRADTTIKTQFPN